MKKKATHSVRKRLPARTTRVTPENHFETVFTARQIQKRVQELADQISRDYRGRTLHVIGILENAFVFMADLVRVLKVPVICHFVRAEVRDIAGAGVAMREIMYTPPVDAVGKDVLLVDGILQSGVTLDHLYRYILGQNAQSVKTATLVEKTDERKVDVPTDYVGFKIAGKFLAGYGLGYQEKYRNLPRIVAVG